MRTLFLFCLLSTGLYHGLMAQKNLKFRMHFGKASASEYTPDQTLLAIAADNEVHFYTAGTTTFVKKIKPEKGQITSISLHEDGKHIITSSLHGKVVLWDYTTNIFVKSWEVKHLISASLFENFKVAAITADSLLLFDFDSQKVLYKKKEHSKPIRSLAISKNNNLVATGGGDGLVVIYQSDGSVLSKKKIHDGWVRTIAFNPEGSLIASGDDQGNFVISDLQGNTIFKSNEPRGWVRSLKFSGDGKYIAVGDEKGQCLIY